MSLRERALAYLARREHSRQELYRKLAPYAAQKEELDALLEDFQRRGWLSEARFAEQLVHARKTRYGSLKIAHELRDKGVSEAVVQQVTASLDDLKTAHAVWLKKFGHPPESPQDWARQARFLQNRGFGHDVIKQILRQDIDLDTTV
ncbi:MAG: recombination regulator RecX [Methylophilaceae bacterium]|nr:recombination regulator RecX [Methylophilaceae bacterium]